MICDLLSSAEKGNQCYKDFVRQRLVSKQLSIFASIRKNKLKTGITKPQKTPKPVEVLKEDVQGFGILAEHKTTLKEAFKIPNYNTSAKYRRVGHRSPRSNKQFQIEI